MYILQLLVDLLGIIVLCYRTRFEIRCVTYTVGKESVFHVAGDVEVCMKGCRLSLRLVHVVELARIVMTREWRTSSCLDDAVRERMMRTGKLSLY